jgi:hypothetical protein
MKCFAQLMRKILHIHDLEALVRMPEIEIDWDCSPIFQSPDFSDRLELYQDLKSSFKLFYIADVAITKEAINLWTYNAVKASVFDAIMNIVSKQLRTH